MQADPIINEEPIDIEEEGVEIVENPEVEENNEENEKYVDRNLPDNWREVDYEKELKSLTKIQKPDFSKQKAELQQYKAKIDNCVLRMKGVDEQISGIISSKTKTDPRSEILNQLKEKKTERGRISTSRKELLKKKEELDFVNVFIKNRHLRMN